MSENLLTMKRFLSFVESKRPKEKYNYWDEANCACAQFCKSLGLPYSVIGEGKVPAELESIACRATGDDGRVTTFGQLAKFIRAHHPELA